MARLSLESKNKSTRDRLRAINKKAFTDRLKKPVDEFQVLEDWTEHFQDCAKRWMSSEQDRFLAGYTVLFQSSGMGKTLLLMRYLQQNYGVYICLRPVSTTNYPPRAIALADWLLEKDYTQRFRSLSCAVAQVFMQWFERQVDPTPMLWLQHQQGPAEDFSGFSQTVRDVAKSLLEDLPDVKLPKDMLLAIFFDEGREILNARVSDSRNAFRHVRDAWKKEALPPRVFVALTDTLSTLTNFAPPARADSSGRPDVPSTFFRIWTFLPVGIPRPGQQPGPSLATCFGLVAHCGVDFSLPVCPSRASWVSPSKRCSVVTSWCTG
jgi:hypothetical protein